MKEGLILLISILNFVLLYISPSIAQFATRELCSYENYRFYAGYCLQKYEFEALPPGHNDTEGDIGLQLYALTLAVTVTDTGAIVHVSRLSNLVSPQDYTVYVVYVGIPSDCDFCAEGFSSMFTTRSFSLRTLASSPVWDDFLSRRDLLLMELNTDKVVTSYTIGSEIIASNYSSEIATALEIIDTYNPTNSHQF